MPQTFQIKSITHEIVSGPSREEMFDSLRLFKKKMPVEISYRGENNRVEKIKVQINQIAAEDGSGDSWICRGYNSEAIATCNHSYIEFHFHTQTRKGWIKFIPI